MTRWKVRRIWPGTWFAYNDDWSAWNLCDTWSEAMEYTQYDTEVCS